MKRKWLRTIVLSLVAVTGAAVIADAIRSMAPLKIDNFTATDLQSRPWTLADHRGRGPMILSFFGTW